MPAARVWETLNFCRELQTAGVDLDTRGSARERLGSGMGALAGALGRLGGLGGASKRPGGGRGGAWKLSWQWEPYYLTVPI